MHVCTLIIMYSVIWNKNMTWYATLSFNQYYTYVDSVCVVTHFDPLIGCCRQIPQPDRSEIEIKYSWAHLPLDFMRRTFNTDYKKTQYSIRTAYTDSDKRIILLNGNRRVAFNFGDAKITFKVTDISVGKYICRRVIYKIIVTMYYAKRF